MLQCVHVVWRRVAKEILHRWERGEAEGVGHGGEEVVVGAGAGTGAAAGKGRLARVRSQGTLSLSKLAAIDGYSQCVVRTSTPFPAGGGSTGSSSSSFWPWPMPPKPTGHRLALILIVNAME